MFIKLIYTHDSFSLLVSILLGEIFLLKIRNVYSAQKYTGMKTVGKQLQKWCYSCL